LVYFALDSDAACTSLSGHFTRKITGLVVALQTHRW